MTINDLQRKPLEGLNGAQMAAVQRATLEFIERIKLRQWCIEKAIETDVSDRVEMARSMYDFIIEAPVVVVSEEE
jgi:hypothetical protein